MRGPTLLGITAAVMMPQWLSWTAMLHGLLLVMKLQVYREEAGDVVMMVTFIDMFVISAMTTK